MTVPIVADIHLNRAAVFLVDRYQDGDPRWGRAEGVFVHCAYWGHGLPEDVRLALDLHTAYDQWDEPRRLMPVIIGDLMEHYPGDLALGTTLPDTVDYPVVVVDLAFKQVAFALADEVHNPDAWVEHMSFQSYTQQIAADYPGEAHEKEVEAAYQSLVAD